MWPGPDPLQPENELRANTAKIFQWNSSSSAGNEIMECSKIFKFNEKNVFSEFRFGLIRFGLILVVPSLFFVLVNLNWKYFRVLRAWNNFRVCLRRQIKHTQETRTKKKKKLKEKLCTNCVRAKSNCVSQLISVYKMFSNYFRIVYQSGFMSILRTKELKTLKCWEVFRLDLISIFRTK